MTNPNDSAHPFTQHQEERFPQGETTRTEIRYTFNKGLTKREYFAAMAMQGLYDAVHSSQVIHQAAEAAFPSTEVQKTAIDSLLCQSINTITTNREADGYHEKVINREHVYLHFKELTTIKNHN